MWSTDVSKSPWNDASVAAQVFGHESANAPAQWRAELEPSGKAGALIIAAQGNAELYLFEQGRGTVRVDTAKQSVEGLSGVVKVAGTWYLGSQVDTMFRVFRVDGSRVSMIAELPLADRSSALASTLVRTTRGERLGIWVRSAHPSTEDWFVYSIDREKGQVLDVITLQPRELAKLPRSCEEDEDGWLLVGDVPEPNMDFPPELDRLSVKRVEARMFATHDGLCVQSMAAQADGSGALEHAKRSQHPKLNAPTFALTLTDRGAGSRRWTLRCSR